MIRITYSLDNRSDSITVKDFRMYPQFEEPLQSKVIDYDPMCLDEYLCLKPAEHVPSIGHTILVKNGGLSDMDIITLAEKAEIKVTFFTGGFSMENGQKYVGLGKKKMSFLFNLSEINTRVLAEL